jgi:hypothetical protein
MAAAKYNLNLEQGVPFTDNLVLKDNLGAIIVLTGYTARMQVKPFKTSSEVLFTLTSSDDIIITPELGSVQFTISENNSYLLQYSKSVYDLYLYKPDGTPIRVVEGDITVSATVTRKV